MRHGIAVLFICCLSISPVRADELKSFPAAKHKAGELRYIDHVPVLTLRGKPAEMGEQFGILEIGRAHV